MSRHRIFQNYDYENELDDFDGQGEVDEEEEGQEELSPEDKAQMAQGTAEIISLLGTQADKVTQQQIQDALWHYYYDIDKSVAYLVGKFVDPTPQPAAKPKPSQVNKPSEGTCASPFVSLTPSRQQVFSEADSLSREPKIPMTNFFADMPWLDIPEDRRTIFIAPPRQRGGLLGGSSTPKLSKLQALAAARKRKANEEATLVLLPKDGTTVPGTQSKSGPPLQPGGQEETRNQDASRKKTKNESAQDGDVRKENHAANSASEGPAPKEYAPSWSSQPRSRPQTDGAFDETTMARPSAFAQVLCFGSASAKPPASPPPPESQSVEVAGLPPWAAFTTPEALREAFDQPSPDDLVFAAQNQSALSQSQSKSAPSQAGSRK